MTNCDLWMKPENPFEDNYKYRKRLPATSSKRHETSQLWNLMKSNLGKDLSKTTLPIQLNEPISFLQRICESLEYSYLLFQASLETDPIIRLEIITAFVISSVSSSNSRTGKPFNPILGETYELNRLRERGYQFISEQVSHHPPITAFYTHADPYFRYSGSIHPKIKFCATSLEIRPKGNIYLQLLRSSKRQDTNNDANNDNDNTYVDTEADMDGDGDFINNKDDAGEMYIWQSPIYCVNNLLLGKTTIAYQGETTIRCSATGLKSVITWKSTNCLFNTLENQNDSTLLSGSDNSSPGNNTVEAYISSYQPQKKQNQQQQQNKSSSDIPLRILYGNWSDCLHSVSADVWNKYKNKMSNKNSFFNDLPFGGVVSKIGGGMRLFHNSSNNIAPSVSLEIPNGPNHAQSGTISIHTSYSPVFDRRQNWQHHKIGNKNHRRHNTVVSSGSSSPHLSDDEEGNLQFPDQQCLWQANSRPDDSELYFNFSYFTMLLNQIENCENNDYPRTDSRLRPDIRLLEEGKDVEAGEEKLRLENKQRARKKELKRLMDKIGSNKKKSKSDNNDDNNVAAVNCDTTAENNVQASTAPLWFDWRINPITNAEEWIFNGKYLRRIWAKCPDIF